jgi:hypothetical protein
MATRIWQSSRLIIGSRRGVERVEGFGDFFADFGVGFAEAGQDELKGTQGGELLAEEAVGFER